MKKIKMKVLNRFLQILVLLIQPMYVMADNLKIVSINFTDQSTVLSSGETAGPPAVASENWNNLTVASSNLLSNKPVLVDEKGNTTVLSISFSGDGFGTGSEPLQGTEANNTLMRWGLRSVGPRSYPLKRAQVQINGLNNEFPDGYSVYVYLTPTHEKMGASGAIYLGGKFTLDLATPAMPPFGATRKIDYNVSPSIGFSGTFTPFNGYSVSGNYGVFSNLIQDQVVISVDTPSQSEAGTWFDAAGISGIQIVGPRPGRGFKPQSACGEFGQETCKEWNTKTHWGCIVSRLLIIGTILDCSTQHTELNQVCHNNLIAVNDICTPTHIDILDVWGEGRIDDDGQISGFTNAININKEGKTVSNGPNRGQAIPKLLPIKNYDSPIFPVANDSVRYITLMGAPITVDTAKEMVRVLDKNNGVVILYNPSSTHKANFENAANGILTSDSHWNVHDKSPFNEISGPYYPASIYVPINSDL